MWTADVYTPEGLVGFLSLSGIFQVYYFIKETHRGCVWWHMPFNPSTWEVDTDLCEFKASLIYKESSRRAAKIIQEDLCLKNQKGKKNPQSKASGDPCRKQTALPIEGGHRVLQCVAIRAPTNLSSLRNGNMTVRITKHTALDQVQVLLNGSTQQTPHSRVRLPHIAPPHLFLALSLLLRWCEDYTCSLGQALALFKVIKAPLTWLSHVLEVSPA